ncbi:hypothetical protein NW757_008970 [Fusarium falciforme]|nr:hypothetical protein NW757_008970 [Fusarium falciforme]
MAPKSKTTFQVPCCNGAAWLLQPTTSRSRTEADEPARCPEAFHSLHPRRSSQPLTGERHKWQKLQGCMSLSSEKRFRGPVDSTHARRSSYSVTPQPPPNLDIYS